MAKRKPMGEAAVGLFDRTGAEALAAVTGASSPAPAKRGKARAPKGKATKGRASARAAAPAEASPRWVVTTIRLEAKHWQALRMAALERATARGAGKADASEVLRELLDAWMKER